VQHRDDTHITPPPPYQKSKTSPKEFGGGISYTFLHCVNSVILYFSQEESEGKETRCFTYQVNCWWYLWWSFPRKTDPAMADRQQWQRWKFFRAEWDHDSYCSSHRCFSFLWVNGFSNLMTSWRSLKKKIAKIVSFYYYIVIPYLW